jgi:hypothetical protein
MTTLFEGKIQETPEGWYVLVREQGAAAGDAKLLGTIVEATDWMRRRLTEMQRDPSDR